MQLSTARQLARQLDAYAKGSPERVVAQFARKAEELDGFHQWADGRPALGAWLVDTSPARLWLAVVDWKINGNFYLVLFPENRAGPIAELHREESVDEGAVLAWRYAPRLRDGRNPERVAQFERAHGSVEVVVQLPTSLDDIEPFLSELAWVAVSRSAADALVPGEELPLEVFPEGRLLFVRHLKKERSEKLIRLAKERAVSLGQPLRCGCCGFDFEAVYGEVGRGFIEAHHTIPVSELPDYGADTRIEDLALVCANCHRMLHRRRPWLGMDQLRTLLSKRKPK